MNLELEISPEIENLEITRHKVLDIESSVWVAATAGGGKTTLIVEKALKFIVKGVDPKGILILSFAREAVEEIKNRIESRLRLWSSDYVVFKNDVKSFGLGIECFTRNNLRKITDLYKNHPIKINTVHGFCFELISKFPKECGFNTPDVKVWSQNHLVQIVSRETKNYLFTEVCSLTLHQVLKKTSLILRISKEMTLAEEENILCSQKIPYTRENLLREIVARELMLGKFILNSMQLDLEKLPELANLLHQVNTKAHQNLIKEIDEFTDALGEAFKNPQKEFTMFHVKHCEILIDTLLTKAHTPRLTLAKGKISEEIKTIIMSLQSNLEILCAQYKKQKKENITRETSQLFNRLAAVYRSHKREAGTMDFHDMIDLALYALRESPYASSILYSLKEIEHIIIDEAQDLSEDQWAIVRLITEEFFSGQSVERQLDPTLCVVGDVKQSIFSFQGSRPDLFWEYRDYFAEKAACANKKFSYSDWDFSFRLPRQIGDFVDKNFNDQGTSSLLTLSTSKPLKHYGMGPNIGSVEMFHVKHIKPLNLETEMSHVEQKSNSDFAAEMMIAKINEFLVDGLYEPKDIMVLFRSRNQIMKKFIAKARDKNLKIQLKDSFFAEKNRIITAFTDLSWYLLEHKNEKSLFEFLCFYLEISNIDYVTQIKIFVTQKLSKGVSLEQTFEILKETSEFWSMFYSRLEFYKVAFEDDIFNFLLYFFSEFGNDSDLNLVGEILELCDINKTTRENLEELIPEIKDNLYSFKCEVEEGGIRIMTIHASKGLESKLVLVFDDIKGAHNFDLTTKEGALDYAEELRIRYVAYTRAKEKLIIFHF